MAEAFDALAARGVITSDLAERLRRAVGFRNVAIHQYEAIDRAIVHAIAHGGVEDFRQFAESVASLPDS